jgi:hypothetical protein
LREGRLLLADLENRFPAATTRVDPAQVAERAAQGRVEPNRLGVGANRSVAVAEASWPRRIVSSARTRGRSASEGAAWRRW